MILWYDIILTQIWKIGTDASNKYTDWTGFHDTTTKWILYYK